MKSLLVRVGTIFLLMGSPILCYGQKVITRIGDYYIGQDIKTVRGLVEFTSEEYAVFQSFPDWFNLPGEKIFKGPDITLNRHLWYLTIGSLNGKIYVLALQHFGDDRAIADSLFEETLKYIKSQIGAATEQTKTPKRYVWNSTDGNVLLAERQAMGFWSVNFLVTGKKDEGVFKEKVGKADWNLYMENDFGKWFYNSETITRPSKDTVKVWGRTVYTDKGVEHRVTQMRAFSEKYRAIYEKYKDLGSKGLAEEYKDLASKYKGLGYEQNLIEFNCADMKSRTLKGTAHSRNGTILSTYTPKNPDWNEVMTGTPGEMLYKILCK